MLHWWLVQISRQVTRSVWGGAGWLLTMSIGIGRRWVAEPSWSTYCQSYCAKHTPHTTHDIIVTSLPSAASPLLQVQCFNQRASFSIITITFNITFMFEDVWASVAVETSYFSGGWQEHGREGGPLEISHRLTFSKDFAPFFWSKSSVLDKALAECWALCFVKKLSLIKTGGFWASDSVMFALSCWQSSQAVQTKATR